MSDKKKLVANYIYNMIYQVVNILIPIITIPYASRVLGAEGIGASSYTNSIAIFFTVLCVFGINNYGSKMIAYVRGDYKKISNQFWNIWFLQLVMSLIAGTIYIISFVILDILGMRFLVIMQFPWILASLIDISWFFVGIEDFKKTVTRNVLVKVLGLILIFILVKSKADLWIYVLINSLCAFLGNLIFWILISKYVQKPKRKNIDIFTHFKGALFLLIPQIIAQVYITLDRTIIGNLSSLVEVGYYDQSQKIARIALTLVTSLSIVIMPRIANMYAKKELNMINLYLKKSVNFTLAFSILITSTLAAVSKHFVPIFFGDDFIVIVPYMMISSLIIIFISIGGVFANQYTLPTGKNTQYIIPLIVAAILNVISNIILVPILGVMGGVISIVFTEFCVAILRIFLVRKDLNIKFLFKGTYVYWIAGFSSFFITLLISMNIKGNFFELITEGCVSVGIYTLIIFLVNNPIKNEILTFVNNKKVKR